MSKLVQNTLIEDGMADEKFVLGESLNDELTAHNNNIYSRRITLTTKIGFFSQNLLYYSTANTNYYDFGLNHTPKIFCK